MAGMPTMGQIWLLLLVATAGLILIGALIAFLIALARYREPSEGLSVIGVKGLLREFASRTCKISSALIVLILLILALTMAA
ncbi:hypothetical protein [Phaeobacter gallaeciensis]|uniref:Uncharacterized protein n=1 Tax=Phaeobacter gallaeciensis TaxID=60890 RepID=A0AAC9Z6C3_9RHOB|nr:hypothetical protein [Phaeobacter gallaeciensis]AHD08078.1 hypothetical protein Gal_00279 [Phaeobacter gallaeciensis DSM 26640]ATE91344.1 hypothetical protein PhaeoP11_00277 [Phaeobacter gallaeciensis]ATE95620.1 hypothetical protein PhaeoP73_00278 [Phaeobacter gallaeciensis]ATE99959.1 hypothetical protein PhaeoP75_00278 [Phaeobacter gallaeciensis]ATF04392.1 hypothetical protein PhaeoP63_00278 [Phaeobacter gallaeciensis]